MRYTTSRKIALSIGFGGTAIALVGVALAFVAIWTVGPDQTKWGYTATVTIVLGVIVMLCGFVWASDS